MSTENVTITAAEAREITNTSAGMLDAIHEQIRIEAKLWNRSVCNWGFDGVDEEIRDRILNDLKDEGYTCEEFVDQDGNVVENQYKIKW